MIESLVLGILMLMLIMGTVASTGWDVQELRNREVWWWTCMLMLEALLMQNLYAAALLGTVILGLFQIGRSWYVLRSTIIPVAGISGAYALLAPYMKLWMIPWLLWAGVSIGLFLSLYAAIGMYITKRPFRLILPKSWFGMWGIYEDLADTGRHLCGQANRMHICALSALAQGCAAGLILLGHWWAIAAFVVCYLPQHVNWRIDPRHPHVGHLGLLALALATCWLTNPFVAMGIFVMICALALLLILKFKPWANGRYGWMDSGRLSYWLDVWKLVYWPSGWRQKLFGFGTCTWFLKTIMIGEKKHCEVYTAAHNEYFQQLLEHGLIGLLVMLAYLGEALWRTSHGLPAQQAVFLVGAVWCAIALVHFPASIYHEYHPSIERTEHWYGSPPLNVWTFLIALLVEAR